MKHARRGSRICVGKGTNPDVRQRGTTLLEVMMVTAIAVLIAVAVFAWSQGARAFAMRSAVDQFDAVLADAQATAASSGNGATLVFDKPAGSAAGSGFTLTLYSGRPSGSGAMRNAGVPPLQSASAVSEARLGGVPFTIFLNAAGHASGIAGAVSPSSAVTSDPGCPPGEDSIVLTFSDARSSAVRVLPCNAPVAGQPASIGTVAPEPGPS